MKNIKNYIKKKTITFFFSHNFFLKKNIFLTNFFRASINFLIIPSSVINSNKNIGAAKPPDKSLYASLMFLFIIEAHLMQFNMYIYIYILVLQNCELNHAF